MEDGEEEEEVAVEEVAEDRLGGMTDEKGGSRTVTGAAAGDKIAGIIGIEETIAIEGTIAIVEISKENIEILIGTEAELVKGMIEVGRSAKTGVGADREIEEEIEEEKQIGGMREKSREGGRANVRLHNKVQKRKRKTQRRSEV